MLLAMTGAEPGREDDNREVYEESAVIDVYAEQRPPQVAEERIFGSLRDQLRTASLLDIGIGGGRTTAFLGPMVSEYVGIDYSHGLVAAAQRIYPAYRIQWGDARALTDFADGSFDFVFFSFNGIDSVSHEDRLQILSESRRVLRPGGNLIFSSHNRSYERLGLLPWQGHPKWGRVTVKKSLEAIAARGNRRRLRSFEHATETYALVNDEAHAYSLLHYYISAEHQRAQLEAAGFSQVEVFDQWGEATDSSSASIWLYYSARSA